jgi:hypothetical protein
MEIHPVNRELNSDKWLSNISLSAGFLWLFIFFALRRIFQYFQLDLFVLGILPSFFSGIGIYLFLYLKLRSKLLSSILTFLVLSATEIIQLFTPRTFDPLDFIASIFGIGCAEVIRGLIEKKRII